MVYCRNMGQHTAAFVRVQMHAHGACRRQAATTRMTSSSPAMMRVAVLRLPVPLMQEMAAQMWLHSSVLPLHQMLRMHHL